MHGSYRAVPGYYRHLLWDTQVGPLELLQQHLSSVYEGQLPCTKRIRHPAPYIVVTTPELVI